MTGLRRYNAEYYDAFYAYKGDILFYEQFISDSVSVLELGCGTGRVAFPLAKKAKQVVGVDVSGDMISRAKKKLKSANVEFLLGDMSSLNLKAKFDLIIAPFRVLQTLETEDVVLKSLKNIKKHMNPEGLGILNVFNPYLSKDDMKIKWIQDNKTDYGETVLESGDILKYNEVRKHLDAENQVLYVDIIYRRYQSNKLVDEHVNPLCMRYYYPDEFKNLISQNGFTIKNCWGGYNGEVYGTGPELVIAFN